MPTKYSRPDQPLTRLQYVGGAPPVVTPAHAYDVSKDATDINLSNVNAVQKTTTVVGNVIGLANDWAEMAKDIQELHHAMEVKSFADQVQGQEKPGQEVQLVISRGENRDPEVLGVLSPRANRADRFTGYDREDPSGTGTSVVRIVKPGPGDSMCLTEREPETTVFTIKVGKEELTFRLDSNSGGTREQPTGRQSPSAVPARAETPAKDDQGRQISLP